MNMNWFKQIVTGKDGATHDLGRWSWILSMASIIGHSAWAAGHGATVDLVQLATAISAVVTAHGAALFLKKDTEPQ